jgi:Sugar transferases involved in lipopolysaccharide synthesis
MLTKYNRLPQKMQNDDVRRYYNILDKKHGTLFAKRLFDIVVSFVMLAVMLVFLAIIAAAIKLDSRGPVFYRQERYTRDMRKFRIFKFRSMVMDADKSGPLVTLQDDARVTKVGAFLRRTRLDELPQLINVLTGDMSFVGIRPEVEKYVLRYSDPMLATLLLPAGITSRTSIEYKDEAALLQDVRNADEVYIQKILPQKMELNLRYMENIGFFDDIKILFSTLFAVSK